MTGALAPYATITPNVPPPVQSLRTAASAAVLFTLDNVSLTPVT